MKDSVRLGCFAAFWGDTRFALRDILDGAEVDYLVADYLSEITMALLARARAKDPDGGYIADFVTTIEPVLGEIVARDIKVVVNAGALNPATCAQAVAELAADKGLTIEVAAVEGDDLMPMRDEVLAASPDDMVTGLPVPTEVSSLNAYLGARPIAAALGAGAHIVITGRCVDAAVVLGPLMHEFGWTDDDHDLLAAGSLVGHILECGPQATGGNVTDWADVPGWDHMGYPVAECFRDGTALIGKPTGTGGLVTPATVAEQIVYEIGDPGAYLLPDVVCDWRGVTLTQDEDRVRVAGARGSAPTRTYKVTATSVQGYRVLTTAMFAGRDAAAKSRRMAEALIARTERLIDVEGLAPLDRTSVEVIGSGQLMGHSVDVGADEAVVKIGAHSADRASLEVLSTEFASFALVAQGMTGVFAGRPRVAPAIAVHHLLVDKSAVPVQVRIGDSAIDVKVAPGIDGARTSTPTMADERASSVENTVTVPLVAIAQARSGDKGDLANIGVLARCPDFVPILHDQVSPARVAEFFAHLEPSGVSRWALPGLDAINIVVHDVLGGTGGTSTLRFDPQGKSYAAMLLTMPIQVDESWVYKGAIDPDYVRSAVAEEV